MRPGAGCHLRGETLAGCRLLSDAGWVERARGVTYVVKRWSGVTYVVTLGGWREATNEVERGGVTNEVTCAVARGRAAGSWCRRQGSGLVWW